MQAHNSQVQLAAYTCLDELDNALYELGMLATRTKGADEYLAEIQNKKLKHIGKLVTVDAADELRKRRHVRFKPYKTVKERHRTRSENNDNDIFSNLTNSVEVEAGKNSSASASSNILLVDDLNQLKKAKSLESIVAESGQKIDLQSIYLENCKEVENVSNCIQNLKVE